MSLPAVSTTLPNNDIYREPQLLSPAEQAAQTSAQNVSAVSQNLPAPAQTLNSSQTLSYSGFYASAQLTQAAFFATQTSTFEPAAEAQNSPLAQTQSQATAIQTTTQTQLGTTPLPTSTAGNTSGYEDFNQLLNNVINASMADQNPSQSATTPQGAATSSSGVGSTYANVVASATTGDSLKAADASTLV